MSSHPVPCSDPDSPAPPLQSADTNNQTGRLVISDEILEKFYQGYGADGRRTHELKKNPYSQRAATRRIWLDRRKKKGSVGLRMMGEEREAGGWLYKHRPKVLDEFICHREKALLLREQVAQGVDSHFIFEGTPGLGKKTMVWAFLREAYGPETLETWEEFKECELKGEHMVRVIVNVTLSPQHVEIDLSQFYGYEKHVLTALEEEMLASATECNHTDSRAIVLYHADQLCMDTQRYICELMERHRKCHKFLFCCTDLYNLELIRSVCTVVRLLPPSSDEICSVLEHIAEKEGVELPRNVSERIAKDSRYNFRQAVRLFESLVISEVS